MTTTRRAIVVVADGTEEMEAVIVCDVLRRAGIDVTVAGLTSSEPVVCSRRVRLVPDVALRQVVDENFDAVILPGGGDGAKRFVESSELHDFLRRHAAASRLVAAICAAPTTFVAANLAVGRKLTSHPVRRTTHHTRICLLMFFAQSVAEEMKRHTAQYVDDCDVVVDGQFVTSRAAGTSFAFALELVRLLCDDETRQRVAAPMLLL